MIKEDIDERDLCDLIDVILVYGLPSIVEEEKEQHPGKDERTLRAYQNKYPDIESNLLHSTVEIINKHKLDEAFVRILKGIPAAVTLSKEYKSKPGDE